MSAETGLPTAPVEPMVMQFSELEPALRHALMRLRAIDQLARQALDDAEFADDVEILRFSLGRIKDTADGTWVYSELYYPDIGKFTPLMPGQSLEVARDDGWRCQRCGKSVSPEMVTYEQTHDVRSGGCGGAVA